MDTTITQVEWMGREATTNIPSLALRINPGVWERAVGQHVWNVPPTAPSPHAVKRRETHSLTLRLQNHLHHFNTLLTDLWHWHIDHLLPDRILHALPRHMLQTVQDLRHRVCHDLLHNDLLPTCDRPWDKRNTTPQRVLRRVQSTM